MGSFRRGAWIGGALALAAVASSCRTPTDITLRVTTDIPCSDIGSTTLTIGAPGQLESAPITTSTTTCEGGTIGTLVVLPSGGDDDSVGMKIVSGFQRRGEQCVAPDYKGCVVARRALHFVSHRELTVAVTMAKDCVDVPCTPDETCVGSRCVSDLIPDPTQCDSPQGCGPDLLADGGADGTTIADGGPDGGGPDATVDGTLADAPVDAPADTGGCATGSLECQGRTIAECVGGQYVARADGPCAVACSAGACVAVRAIAAGRKHTCATLTDGTIRCWGDNTNGQLGSAQAPNPSPTPFVGAATIPATPGNVVVAGGDVTCNVRPAGVVECWGINDQGQLAVAPASLPSSPVPRAIPGLTLAAPGATSLPTLAIGSGHVCAVNAAGGVVCWGNDATNQLGSDAASPVLVPTLVPGVVATSVAAGTSHTCSVDNGSGNAVCWGDNTYDQLARGSGREGGMFSLPQAVTLVNAHSVFAGAGADHACAIAGAAKVSCWGRETSGQCGTKFFQFDDPVPTGIFGLGGTVCPIALSAGPEHTCLLNDVACVGHAGEVDCAGANDAGQLGRGNNVDDPQFAPSGVTAVGKAVWLGAGAQHVCVVLDTGAAACWGANDRGQLGRGATSAGSSTPALVTF